MPSFTKSYTTLLDAVCTPVTRSELISNFDHINPSHVHVHCHQGPTNVQDVWEEGYALNELKRRSMELLEKKEEFEKRRKRLQNLKRAAKKGGPTLPGSGNGTNLSMSAPEITDDEPYELDLDLAAESEAIKTHLEQLKR